MILGLMSCPRLTETWRFRGKTTLSLAFRSSRYVRNLSLNLLGPQPDPLRHPSFLCCLRYPSALAAVPLRGLRRLADLILDRLICPAMGCLARSLSALGSFARNSPLLSIPAVLIGNVQLAAWPSEVMSFLAGHCRAHPKVSREAIS